MLEEFADREPNVLGDLAQQNGRDVPTLVKRHGHRPALSRYCLCEPRCLTSEKPSLSKMATTSAGLRTGTFRDLRDSDVVHSDKFRLKLRLTVLQEHGDHFLKVVVQFVERFALRMSPEIRGRSRQTNRCRSRLITAA